MAEKNPAGQKLCEAEGAGSPAFDLRKLFQLLIQFCEASPKPVVLMIDEADSASNNQVFLDFLAQLRNYYLEREANRIFETRLYNFYLSAADMQRMITIRQKDIC